MTRMLPHICPAAASRAEAQMFERIRDCPDSDELICLHSVGIARHDRKDYAEADFVVIAPDGIFCLEVKGGEVERKNGLWKIGSGSKSYTSSEGPFKQAQSARWGLIRYLDKALRRSIRKEAAVGLLETLRSFGAFAVSLNENFRNPKQIAAEACRIAGIDEPMCRRTLRSPVEYRRFADEKDQAKRLRALLLELIKDGVAAGSISILSWVKSSASTVAKYPSDIGKPFSKVEDHVCVDSETFTYGTIAGFKGLENDIVILTDLPDHLGDDAVRSAIYVGMTRARTKLFAFVTDAWLDSRAAQ